MDLTEGKIGNIKRNRVDDEVVIIVLCAKHICMLYHMTSYPHFTNKESDT